MPLANLKHYKDLIWLFYKYGNIEFNDFSAELDVKEIIQERGDQKGKAEDLVKDLEDLGPFYIKLGQILSTEMQLLPFEYDEALQKLQDKATPMPFEDVKDVIVTELGEPPSKIFKKFDKNPLSAASLGQVHVALLPNGKKVAVKIQRKNIQQDLLDLLDVLKHISEFLENKTEYGKKYHVIEKVENLKTTLLHELDYLREAENLKILHENLKEFENLIVPLPIDAYTTSRVLTMDFIKGEKITELSPIEKMDANGVQLAEELFRAFLKQILVDGFFQMDPHPGNIYLTYINKQPYLALFDLGMVAHIPFQLQGKVIQSMIAMSEGREVDVANILISVGTKLPDFDEYLFHSKIAGVVSHYHTVAINRIPMGKLFLQLSHIAAASGLWLPIQFSMIGKTLMSLSTVLKALNPDLNLSEVLKERAADFMNQHLFKQVSYRSIYGSFLEGLEFIQHLPSKLNQLFDMVLKNDFQVKFRLHENEPLAVNFQKIANRITMGILLASLVIASALLMRVDTPFQLFGYPGFAMFLLLLAAGGSIILIIKILISDRKKK